MRSRIRPSACCAKSASNAGTVERGRVVLRDRVAVALLPVAEDVAEQVARPRGTTLEEREPQFGEPHRDTTEEQRPRRQLTGGGEVADVVEHVVRRRRARSPARAGRVEGRRTRRARRTSATWASSRTATRDRARPSSGRPVRRFPGTAAGSRRPSSLRAGRARRTANSSSAIASSGVNVGMQATGRMRSRYGAYTSAT